MQRRDFIRKSGAFSLAGTLAGAPSGLYAQKKESPKSGSRGKDIQAEVVVVGGGMSGVCAAIAAARAGAKVVLIQDRPVLGGNSSSEVRMHVCGADSHDIPDSRETGIIEEVRLEDAVRNPQRCATMWDLILWEKVQYQEGLTLFLNTAMTGCRMDGRRIAAVECYDTRAAEHFRVEASMFVDCTGDGTLGYLAGNPFHAGCEAKGEFDESLAPEKAEPYKLGSSLLFQARDFGRPMRFVPPAWAYRYDTEEEIGRPHDSWEYGYWWIEWGGTLDTIRDDTKIREELLKIQMGVWDHIKNSGLHKSENWALEWFGFLPGRRESRRLEGAYWLRQDDLLDGRVFEDEVAYGGWPIDHHDKNGFYTKKDEFYYQYELKKLYSIPLRSLHSQSVDNLFFAGRQVSASHIAFCSTRVMATCSLMGQGAGVAAAYAARSGKKPLDFGSEDIEAIKQTLLYQDAFLIGTPNRDPKDFARSAKASAGSERLMFEARRVIDGVARGADGDYHQWRSTSLEPQAAWLTLDFGRNMPLKELHLAFDTGLSRVLTLTHDNWYYKQMLPGAQPETVSDYTVEAHIDGGWKTLAQVSGNYQRKNVHRFESVNCDRVRISATATNGVEEARIFEVRCY